MCLTQAAWKLFRWKQNLDILFFNSIMFLLDILQRVLVRHDGHVFHPRFFDIYSTYSNIPISSYRVIVYMLIVILRLNFAILNYIAVHNQLGWERRLYNSIFRVVILYQRSSSSSSEKGKATFFLTDKPGFVVFFTAQSRAFLPSKNSFSTNICQFWFLSCRKNHFSPLNAKEQLL